MEDGGLVSGGGLLEVLLDVTGRRAEGVEVEGVHQPPWATHDDVAEGGEGEAGGGRHTASHQVL